jgi:DNA-binding NarL/FixJ family response regulator
MNSSTSKPYQVKKMRLVLADDNAIFMDCICELLAQYDWLQVVGSASQGGECVELVSKHRPDVVLVDLDMPDLNGFEVTKRIMNMPRHPPVIIMSLYDEPEYREGGENLGVYAYVAKDTASTHLIPLLQDLFKEKANSPETAV